MLGSAGLFREPAYVCLICLATAIGEALLWKEIEECGVDPLASTVDGPSGLLLFMKRDRYSSAQRHGEPAIERRGRRRFPLQCNVLVDPEGHALAGATVNISSNGFYCVLNQPLNPGDEFQCLVDLMRGEAAAALPPVRLNCDVVVLRNSKTPQGFGIACRIHNYTVVRLRPGERVD